VIHERRFELVRETGTLLIDDRLEGAGTHKLSWHFHLAPGVEAIQETDAVQLCHKETRTHWRLTVPANVTIRSVAAWYSPSYGVRIPCQALELEAEVVLPNEAPWHFAFTRVDQEK
jgi:hypothetical protein